LSSFVGVCLASRYSANAARRPGDSCRKIDARRS
jgi:hypothetical protein